MVFRGVWENKSRSMGDFNPLCTQLYYVYFKLYLDWVFMGIYGCVWEMLSAKDDCSSLSETGLAYPLPVSWWNLLPCSLLENIPMLFYLWQFSSIHHYPLSILQVIVSSLLDIPLQSLHHTPLWRRYY